MTDSPSDNARVSATEAQIRCALGLKDTPLVSGEIAPQPGWPGALHPQRRRFVRHGAVPVSVIHREHDDRAGTNELDELCQALREQVAAREHAEHLLQEVQATIRDLQTKSAHEHFARDEAIQHLNGEKQVVELALQRARDELAIEQDLRHKAERERDDAVAARQEAEERLRERPAKSNQSVSEFVEWWKPGWRERIR